jgi:hypothetical protein
MRAMRAMVSRNGSLTRVLCRARRFASNELATDERRTAECVVAGELLEDLGGDASSLADGVATIAYTSPCPTAVARAKPRASATSHNGTGR